MYGTASDSPASVRLFGGDSSSGVLETLQNGRWGMVCGSLDMTGAEAVCSELGFHPPKSSAMSASTL